MKRPRSPVPTSRRGTVLLVVLVVIVLLSLAAYMFTEMSVAENQATTMFGRTTMARSFAESGIDVAATIVSDPVERYKPDPVLNRPDVFSAVLLRISDVPHGRGRFSVVAPALNDPSCRSVRFGLVDESGKLNLNTLIGLGLNDTQYRNMLMNLPYMTYDLADAILDWLDADDTARQYGAESDYYSTQPQPYRAANGPLVSLDELLLVRGVTPALLYGEDANRNGIMDPNEDLNKDGYFDRGWSAYLTIYSAERNLQSDGTPRINLNQQSLPDLYDQVASAFGEDAAKFVVAFRMNGPSSASSGGSGGGRGSSGSRGGSAGGSGATTMTTTKSSSAATTTATSSGNSGGSGRGGNSSSGKANQTVSRGGMNLPMPPSTGNTKFTSVYQLIGASATAQVNGKNAALRSPWQNAPVELAEKLPMLLDKLSLTDDLFIRGRINVNQVSSQVLVGLPNMTEQLTIQILAAQGAGSTSTGSTNAMSPRSSNAWLVTEGIVPVSTMVQLDPYLTGHGDVYRVQSVGYFDQGGPVVRMEAVIDASIQPPRILNLRDLSELGRGFSAQQLGVP